MAAMTRRKGGGAAVMPCAAAALLAALPPMPSIWAKPGDAEGGGRIEVAVEPPLGAPRANVAADERTNRVDCAASREACQGVRSMHAAAAGGRPVLSVQVVADPDGPLEPSVANEVEHALDRVPPADACEDADVSLGDIFSTNGLSAADIAVSLVSRQDGAGRWIVNGTNATVEAVRILKALSAD